MTDIKEILTKVQKGEITVDEALLSIKKQPFEDLDYAKIDLHRSIRQGVAEVIYGAGKTSDQIIGICRAMKKNGQNTILITRIDSEKALAVSKAQDLDFKYYEIARLGIVGPMPENKGKGKIVIATGGTSDMAVAEEAALTCEVFGNEVERLYDVGVAGLHRLLSHLDELMSARVVICIAGMEGALASVVGGLVDCPVIAVPTSVGYGANFEGLSALLSMLNSCASGVSVVNIDNGFGAGFLANRINRM